MGKSAETTGKSLSQQSELIKRLAREVGFDLAGIAPAVTPTGYHSFLDWLNQGYAGEMSYLERRKEAYEHPRYVMSSVRSVLMLTLNYQTEAPPEVTGTEARVSRYAWGTTDYHKVIRKKLKQLSRLIREQYPDCETRGVVDTAPLLERDFAQLAGLGWIGKNTLLLNKREGSWFFLAGLLLSDELEYDEPQQTSHCGTCTRCLEACPTDAFVEAGTLDARKCISYLTIELRDQPIPAELRPGMQDWMFGCDVCQDVCPWNRKAPISGETAFQPVETFTPVDACELLTLDEAAFQERFQSTPMSRARRAGLLRNAAIVLGNRGDETAVQALLGVLNDEEPLIRGAAAWALGRLGAPTTVETLQTRLETETETDVIEELKQALSRLVS
ncbi:tRNA epoxyqueuosine(34) reductase QueG [Gimesia chilikensis]|uniref:tRNA epoxyqueuosine(34) reductase QueG n=1 Tax=Gimesia chilikensis TaxID=2605989 RepID=UPI0011EFAFFC|nr:tRNA epoxyqueuosine(34) reductase QueG [Gimesia chilikensis]KAA0138323.1 tRNA epoxyqueuosine(34) reductase QueG [Gimesia chilikensis]